MPESKRYFSERHGRGPKSRPLTVDGLKRIVFNVWDGFFGRDYFQEAFGYYCVDAGDVSGTTGSDPWAYFLRVLGRDDVWPYREHGDGWDADTVYDMIEAMHDLVSRPVKGHYHDFSGCGWHYHTFDRPGGQREYREELNSVLRNCDPPYEMNDMGEIVETPPAQFRKLLAAPVPAGTEHDLITSKIEAASTRFRARGATADDRRHAVRDLADVLEALRDDVREHMLPADEKALFQLANGFSIRHNNRRQRGDYDRLVWLRWAFYVYLATIHAVLRVRNRPD